MKIAWAPPAGGMWNLETVHLQGGQPRVFQERAPRAFKAGFSTAAARYGLPFDYLDVRFVNDHCYARMRPLGAPEPKPGKARKAPPAAVLKVLARVHPGLRKRTKAARRAIDRKLWQADRERWEQHHRDEMLAAARALQGEPIETIDDAALLDHLHRAGDHLERCIALHFDLTPVQFIPVGRLLVAARRWGIADADVVALLAGSSPASSASATGLAVIARACATAGVEPDTLDDVRAASPEARRALDDYLADHGWRIVTQYSPRGLALIELPRLLVEAIRAASVTSSPGRADVSAVRERVPAGERGAFDDLLADARACYGVRDDNVALTMMWPTGLVRRALLEAGRRLADRGLLVDPSQVFALGESEIAAALHGDSGLAGIAAARVAHIEAAEADGPPAQLGDDEGPPPDPGLFPAALAEMVGALVIGFELEDAFDAEHKADVGWSGAGVGIGTATYTGRACVAASAEDALDRLQPGDVLVTTLTTPAFEAIMPIAGAVVTESGGLMSHTALVCREYGISAVVGVGRATSHITDGETITVDPSSSRVVLGAPVAR